MAEIPCFRAIFREFDEKWGVWALFLLSKRLKCLGSLANSLQRRIRELRPPLQGICAGLQGFSGANCNHRLHGLPVPAGSAIRRAVDQIGLRWPPNGGAVTLTACREIAQIF